MSGRRLDDLIASLMAEHDHAGPLLERFCQVVLDDLGVAAAAITVAGHDGHQLVVAASEEWARSLQALELTLGEGPGVDAARNRGPVFAPDLRDPRRTSRWAFYRTYATQGPWSAQFAFPLQIGTIRLGVMSLYRDRPGPLAEPELAEALVFAEAATILLLHLQDVSTNGDGLPDDLDLSFTSDAALHQATGMISVQADVSMSEALLLLRGRAFGSGRPALAVARDVVAGRLTFRARKGP